MDLRVKSLAFDVSQWEITYIDCFGFGQRPYFRHLFWLFRFIDAIFRPGFSCFISFCLGFRLNRRSFRLVLLSQSFCSIPGGLFLECCTVLKETKPKSHIPSVYALCEVDADSTESLMFSGLSFDAVLMAGDQSIE